MKIRDWLNALTQRRSNRSRWVYVLCLLGYVATALMFAADIGVNSGAMLARLWPLLIPVGILITQLIRPTILGWAVISLPAFLYFGCGIYYAIRNDLGPHPQWDYDREGVIGGSIFMVVLFGVCVALMLAARPKRIT
jgi:hypothetical protein